MQFFIEYILRNVTSQNLVSPPQQAASHLPATNQSLYQQYSQVSEPQYTQPPQGYSQVQPLNQSYMTHQNINASHASSNYANYTSTSQRAASVVSTQIPTPTQQINSNYLSTGGSGAAGLSSRPSIDPRQIPHPTNSYESDQAYYDKYQCVTSSSYSYPYAVTDFSTLDDGNSNPKFIRSTMREIPISDDLTISSGIPLGFICQPFASLRGDEVIN